MSEILRAGRLPACPGLATSVPVAIAPEFLKTALTYYTIADGKVHVAGPSNGGIAALHVAAANPDYFLSVTAFPGYMWEPSNKKLLAIAKMCVYFYVGENDEYRWHDEMKREAEFLSSRGAVAKYSVEKGQRRAPKRATRGAQRRKRLQPLLDMYGSR